MYALGMERVAYRLGTTIGLRVPVVWLERINGQPGALVERVIEGRDIEMASSCVMLMSDVTDAETWPLAVTFDIWLANVDRQPRNVVVEPLPIGRPAKHAVQCRTWWVDHGFTGLMPPPKFGSQFKGSAPENVDIGTGSMVDPTLWKKPGQQVGLIGEQVVRERMPDQLRNRFLALDAPERERLLDQIRAMHDDAIDDAVQEVPGTFMTGPQADLTARLLKLRRDSIDALVSAHW